MREGNNGRGVFWFIPYTLAGVDYGPGKLYDSVINEIVPFESGFPWRQKPEKNREPLMWPIQRQKICTVASQSGVQPRNGSRAVGSASECLQHAYDVIKDRVGEVCGEEGEGRKKRGPAYVQYLAYSS
jgi:hypothetical protein